MTTPPNSCESDRRRRERWLLILGIGWLFDYGLALAVIGSELLPAGVRPVVALLPVPMFGVFMALLISVLRRLDELERRIHLTALAVAVPVGVVGLMCAGLLADWMDAGARHTALRFAWAVLPVAYGVCYAVVRRRYA
ncbi:MAG: hypothetical protein ABIV92_17405 [Thermoflexales bacterium]